jgi:hypothetical protein
MAGHVDWAPLRAELGIWRTDGLTLPLWWRDDDAVEPTPQLDRLAAMGEDLGVPVHLAVIPALAERELVPYVRSRGVFRPLVHGWRHINHASRKAPSSEFCRGDIVTISRAWRGLRRMRKLLGPSLLPVFVPPWNDVAPSLHAPLASLGFRAVSTIGPRSRRLACTGLLQINTHIDVVDWSQPRRLADPDEIVAWLTAHLQDRRAGRCDAAEPLGLMTHHLVHDDAIWDFCAALLKELLTGPGRPVDLAVPGWLDPAEDRGTGAGSTGALLPAS